MRRPTGRVIAEKSTIGCLPTPPIAAAILACPTYHRRLMPNLINAELITVSYGTRTLLNAVSLGVDSGDAIGVVGRNGDGKTALLKTLACVQPPDGGRVTHPAGLSVGYLSQADDLAADETVRRHIVAGRPDHVWARESESRAVVAHLLVGVDLDTSIGRLSGGERRRVALVAGLLSRHSVLMLDEPTNHLDVEAIGWLAGYLADRRAQALGVGGPDRWFLGAVGPRAW